MTWLARFYRMSAIAVAVALVALLLAIAGRSGDRIADAPGPQAMPHGPAENACAELPAVIGPADPGASIWFSAW
jgi:hypothetical protein